MKLTNLVPLTFVGLAVTVSCSQGNLSAPPASGSGASGGASGSGQMTSGGSGGTTGGAGGGTSTGGSTTGGTGGSTTGGTGGSTTGGTGGSTTGGTGGSTGGTVSMGGMGAVAGTGVATGGSSGTGSSVGGSAGMGTGGGSGGMPAGGGMGGTTTTGGSAGMSAAGTGAGGSGGSGALDPNTLVPGLNGWYWEITTTNGQNPGGNNYWLTDNNQSCPTGANWLATGVTRSKDFAVMGTANTKYTINFQLKGAMGFRCYTGGTATTTTPNPNGANNGWYVGGQQANDSIWNTYEIDVQNPSVTGEANTYFLNGVPYSSTAGVCDQELTYDMETKGSFAVMGNSTIHVWTHDTNCKAQQNCGPTPSTGCMPRTIDLSSLNPPATVVHQPVVNSVGGNTFYPQWFYFTVTSITSP